MSASAAMQPTEFRFCFTLDTEPDNLWTQRKQLSFEHFDRLPEFHGRLRDAGCRPTYLTTSEVVESAQGRRAMEACLEHGGCEVGAHFHTWTRSWPFPTPDLGDPPTKAMVHRLGQGTEERMLSYTCEALRKALRVEPRSYRGGRWSLGPHSARSLLNCGIVVDTTVTPGLSWRDKRGPLLDGPDFRSAPPYPYWLVEGADPAARVNGEAPLAEAANISGGQSRVLEIPVGAAWFPQSLRWAFRPPLCLRLARGLSRRVGKPLGHAWLRPTTTSVDDMRATMESLKRRGAPVWVFMIHSSEIVCCDKLPAQADVDRFVQRCVDACRCAAELGARPATLLESAEWAIRSGYVL